MKKYKICPSCKTKNEPTFWECINCEEDLTRVKITDEETEKMIESHLHESSNTPKLVRVCDCGTKNPSNARKCSNCNEDILDITPIPDEEEKETEKYTFVLSSLDGQFAYKLIDKETNVGRENSMSEYLSSKSYVSRLHAKLIIENNELYIENLSSTNFTYINNVKINDKTKLFDGDEIGLGGTNINGKCQNQAAYFLVRIGQCM